MDNHLYAEFTLLSAISKPVLKKKIKKKKKIKDCLRISMLICKQAEWTTDRSFSVWFK